MGASAVSQLTPPSYFGGFYAASFWIAAFFLRADAKVIKEEATILMAAQRPWRTWFPGLYLVFDSCTIPGL